MAATKDLAFVLKTHDYRETSLMADLYTRGHGKVRGIIKGIRDTRARFGGTLEPFSLNEILFYRKKKGGDMHLVTHVECLDAYPAVRGDLERLAQACYCTELLNELSGAEDPSPASFDLFRDVLGFLGTGASPRRAARIFEIKLLGELGLMPETRACVSCGRPAPDPAYFSVPAGGIHCKGCGSGQGVPISKGALQFIEHVRRSDVAGLGRVKVSQEVGAELEKTLRRFIDYQLPAKLKTLTFMEKMETAFARN